MPSPNESQSGTSAAERAVLEGRLPNLKLKLLDRVREVLRLKHYSLSTDRNYCDWVRRYVTFHAMRSRADLNAAEPKTEQFLSDLAVQGQVPASTQNHAFHALRFLYQELLGPNPVSTTRIYPQVRRVGGAGL